MSKHVVPQSAAGDSDDVVVALETARVLEEAGDHAEAARWLQKAAGFARKSGRPERAGELSRAAARISSDDDNAASFEPRTEEPRVLGDAEDEDFSDQTIVDSAAKLRAAEPLPGPDTLPAPRPDATVDKQLVLGGTPVAPGSTPAKLPMHQALRVAVRRSLGGRLEARPLSTGEAAGSGEEEALLVALDPRTRLL
jgi:hypothetical protein